MTRGRNKLKIMILGYVQRTGGASSREIAESLRLDIGLVKVSLLNYRRGGLLGVVKGRTMGRLRNIYVMTERGRDRLEWLI